VYFQNPIKVSIVIASAPTVEEENMVEESVDEGDVTEKRSLWFWRSTNWSWWRCECCWRCCESGEDVNVVRDGVDEGGEDVDEVEVCEDLNYIEKGVDEGEGDVN